MRRIVVSFLLFVLVVGVGVTAAGTSGPDEGTGWPVPALRPGDEGRYESPAGNLSFRFTQEPLLMPDGLETTRLALAIQRTDIMVNPRGWYAFVEPTQSKHWLEGTATIASMSTIGGHFEGLWVPSSGGPSGVGENTTSGGSYELFAVTFDDVDEPFCGLVHDLQGQRPLAGKALSSPDCGEPLPFMAWNGTTGADYGVGATRLAVDARFPVPVTIETAGQLWTLAAFQRGGLNFTATTGEVHPLQFQPAAFPEEAGVQHPFPLSTALAQAIVQDSLFAETLAQPGGYLAEASFVEKVENGDRRLAWALTAWDGADAARVDLVLIEGQVAPQNGTELSVPLPPTIDYADTDMTPPTPKAYPPRPAFEPAFPSLADLVDRWHRALPPAWQEGGLNAWGFGFDCAYTCEADDLRIWIGTNRIVEDGAADARATACRVSCPGGLGYVLLQDLITIDARGQTTELRHSEWSFHRRVAGLGEEILVVDDGNNGVTIDAGQTGDEGRATSSWALPDAGTVVGVTLVGLVVAVLYQLWPALKGAAVGVLRSTPPPPENPLRLAAIEAVTAEPGIHFHALMRKTGIASGTLRHHLDVLLERGTLTAVASGGYKCFFLAHRTSRERFATAGVLQAPAARNLLHGIVRAGHLSIGDAAVHAGLAASTTSYHINRLEAAGLVVRRRAGRLIEVRPTPAARGLVASEA